VENKQGEVASHGKPRDLSTRTVVDAADAHVACAVRLPEPSCQTGDRSRTSLSEGPTRQGAAHYGRRGGPDGIEVVHQFISERDAQAMLLRALETAPAGGGRLGEDAASASGGSLISADGPQAVLPAGRRRSMTGANASRCESCTVR
jgi:hypothetical protein